MFRIDGNLTPEQDAALTDYLRGAERLTREQWRRLREAIDLLARSTVTFQGRDYTFKWFYETFIDRRFANAFLQTLVTTADVTQDAPRLQAATARQIAQWIQQQDFYQKGQAESRWLLIFCLYWWSAFALGYAFELEIFRDLRAEGIEFFCHDITNRSERLSPFDLTVLGLRGDVKYSAWFLTVENARTEGLDFFITRLYDETGARWLRVVLLTPIARELIGGETALASPAETVPALPDAVTAGAATLVLIRYDDWKARVRLRQTPKGDNPNG
jgi:hypothetical protein